MRNFPELGKPFVSVMGIMGAGKTTAAKLIAKERNFAFLPEQYDENPFMDDYYADEKNYAFQAQLFFFLSKARRHKEKLPTMFKNPRKKGVVDDSPLAQDGAYAWMHRQMENINDRDWLLYNMAFDHRDTMMLPDLVIYLEIGVETALQRIKERGRDYEKNVTPEYLSSLNTSLVYALERMPKKGILTARFPTHEINFAENADHQQQFLAFVDEQIAQLKTQTY